MTRKMVEIQAEMIKAVDIVQKGHIRLFLGTLGMAQNSCAELVKVIQRVNQTKSVET